MHDSLPNVPVDRRHHRSADELQIYEARIRQLEQQLLHATEIANRDPLTGVLNRRGLSKALKVLNGRTTRSDSPVACVAIDLDNFKETNDRFGHPEGDAALQAFAVALTASCRSEDICARLGGDEFLLLLPGTTADQASQLLDRIRGFMEQAHPEIAERQYRLSFSAGIATVESHGTTEEELLCRADGALLDAKRVGKDRSVIVISAASASGHE